MTHLVLPAFLDFSFATLPFPPCVSGGLPLLLKHIMFILGLWTLYLLLSRLGMLITDTSHPSFGHQFKWYLLRKIIFRLPNLTRVPFLTLKLLYIVILFYFLHDSWHLNLLVPLVYYLMRVGTLTCSLLYPPHLEQYMCEIFNNHLLTDKWMKNEYIFQVGIWRDHYPGVIDRIIWRVKQFSLVLSPLCNRCT